MVCIISGAYVFITFLLDPFAYVRYPTRHFAENIFDKIHCVFARTFY